MGREENQWPEREEQPSYLRAMLTSQGNLYALLSTMLASALASFPLGGAGAILPWLAFGAGEAIAAMFIPSAPWFRARVDRAERQRQRAQAIAQLEEELEQRQTSRQQRWQIYRRLSDRIASLVRLKQRRRGSLAQAELDRLQDAQVDYLSLWLLDVNIRERRSSINEDTVQQRISKLEQALQGQPADRASLEKAHQDLSELLLRHRRLAARSAAVEAALLALPDTVEEIYQAVLATPRNAAAGGDRLQEAIERLRLQEELDHQLDFDEPTPVSASLRRRTAQRETAHGR